MATRTDSCIKLFTDALERHRPQVDAEQSLQDCNVKIKFKRGWPFRAVITLNYCHERGEDI